MSCSSNASALEAVSLENAETLIFTLHRIVPAFYFLLLQPSFTIGIHQNPKRVRRRVLVYVCERLTLNKSCDLLRFGRRMFPQDL